MTYRVTIASDPLGMRLRVYVMAPWGEQTRILGPHLLTDVTDTVVDNNVAMDGVPSTFELPSTAAPALLAALSRHLGAVEHPEQLRRDYLDERARVDRLIGHLIGAPR